MCRIALGEKKKTCFYVYLVLAAKSVLILKSSRNLLVYCDENIIDFASCILHMQIIPFKIISKVTDGQAFAASFIASQPGTKQVAY